MTNQNLPHNEHLNNISFVCAARPLMGSFSGLMIPAGKVGKVIDHHAERGKLWVDFGLPSVHLISLTDNQIAIITTQEATR